VLSEHQLIQTEPSLSAWLVGLAIGAVLWGLAYRQLTSFADAIIGLFGLSHGNHLGEAVHFLLFDTPKVLLLIGIVFIMGVIQTFFSPERTRALLSGKPSCRHDESFPKIICSCDAVSICRHGPW